MQQLERRSDRWVSAGLSVLLHGALIGVLVYGWLTFREERRPPPTLAIDATVVSSKALNGGARPKVATPPPTPPLQTVAPPVEPAPAQTVTRPVPSPQTPPPPPATDDQTVPSPPEPKADPAAEQKAQERAEQKAEAEAQRKAAQRQAQEEAERQAAAAAEAERKAQVAEANKRAEQQRLADAKRKAEEQRKLEAARKAEEQRREAEAKALALNAAELQQSVTEDEKLLAERTGPQMASWVQLIQARIERAWIRPPTAKPGIDCTLYVTQVPGGQIVSVKLGPCNGDEAVRQSIEDAAYRASPLPPPPDPALFERELQIEFKPTD